MTEEQHANKGNSELASTVTQDIQVFDQRIKNVEKIVDTFQDVSDKAFRLLNDHFIRKAESDKRQSEVENNQHKRMIFVLTYIFTILFAMCLTAMLLKEDETLKYLIPILSIAIGSGITALASTRPRKKQSSEE